MTRFKQSLVLLSLVGALAGCDSKDWDAVGYADGFATTVSASCGHKAPAVDGRYDKFQYARGYARGAKAAAQDVESKGCTNIPSP